MKRIVMAALSTLMLINLIFPACASNIETKTEYLDDGSFFVTAIEETPSSISLLSTTVTKSKTLTYYAADGTKLWYVKVTGTFTYGNRTAKCTSASASANSYSSTWTITSKSAFHSGNKATASATADCSIGSNENITRTVTLTCSSTGEFS